LWIEMGNKGEVKDTKREEKGRVLRCGELG
jgi:hypothetical protein